MNGVGTAGQPPKRPALPRPCGWGVRPAPSFGHVERFDQLIHVRTAEVLAQKRTLAVVSGDCLPAVVSDPYSP
jgi:hypothetical protein